MKEIASFTTNYSSYQIEATVFFKETGIIIDITGPYNHLGGVGIGIPYLRKNGEESANFHCFSLPSHRDGELAGTIARKIAKTTRFPTLVILGVHFPNIQKHQLNEIIKFFEEWAENIGHRLVNEISLSLNKPE
ncbi:MAG: PilZ domain-containing protein [Candidatus Heimdallarchaeota archaeon]|nr:MAG: PilZ domain-containing protein [Candidatus Heimdallarchaeota archaeon]